MALLASLIPNQLVKMSPPAQLGTKLTTFTSFSVPYLLNSECLLQIHHKEQPPAVGHFYFHPKRLYIQQISLKPEKFKNCISVR
jgi:hypothetical protein